jgi:hypothetical protein
VPTRGGEVVGGERVGRGLGGRRGWCIDEEEVVEPRDVEEDGFIVQEELGEEGEVLAEEL